MTLLLAKMAYCGTEEAMPLVFVHGVNNRKEDVEYLRGVKRTETFLKDIFGPTLRPPCNTLHTTFPYWGEFGVKFRWNQASLPRESDPVEAFSIEGEGDTAESRIWSAEVLKEYGANVNFADVTRNFGLEATLDLVWDTAAQSGVEGNEATSIAASYRRVQTYIQNNPAPPWAMKPQSNQEFLVELERNLAPKEPGTQAMAVGGWFDSIKEGVSRLIWAPAADATALATALWRKKIHLGASRFLGDVFVYLNGRGARDAPGDIVKQVANALDEASKSKKPGDDKLIVIGHSLGGVISYDILTYYRPDICVDTFVTVGSQVAVFEEMTLYKSSDDNIPVNPPRDKRDKPKNIGHWVNVFDTNDVFSFRAGGVFSGVEDYRFDTGYGANQAHSGYFARPSFYKRLAARVRIIPSP
jgi:hypothetical protein